MIDNYFADLKKAFETHSDPVKASGAKAYMRNISEYYGLTSPVRKLLLKEFLSAKGYPPIESLQEMVYFAWEQPQREWQYTAMDITAALVRKGDKTHIELAEWMITHKSWWDSIDFIAPNIAGMLFKKFPDTRMLYIEKWMKSEHLWLQRSCLLHQLKYHKTTDKALLFSLCEQLAGHPDFFIRKAIGWSLRQYSKTSPDEVIAFTNSHQLSYLSRKEALKVVHKNDADLKNSL